MEYPKLLAMRSMAGAHVQETYQDFTRQSFDREAGLPVIIPTYQEAQDLPLALVALARSTHPLHPIIVDSNSNDSTAEIATEMGASVISIGRGQMLGYKAGVEHVQRISKEKSMLITDADCLPKKQWASTMQRKAKLTPSIGGVAFGTTVFFNGPSVATDLTRSLYAISGDSARSLLRRPARPRGSNCFLRLDSQGKILTSLLLQDDRAFGCDVILRNCVQEACGQVVSIVHPNTVTLSNGDRFSSFGQLTRAWWRETTGAGTRRDLYADHGF